MTPCAAILCGGLGTRLSSAVQNKPKALAEVGGQPFIYYLLDQLQKAGTQLAVLCTGFGAEEIEQTLGRWYKDMKLVYSKEPKALGTGGALRHALPYFNSSSILVLNGDSYVKHGLRQFIDWYEKEKIDAGMISVKVQNPGRFGRLNFPGGRKIETFRETDSNTGPGNINAGIYLLKRDFVMEIKDSKFASLESGYFPRWAAEGCLSAYPVEAPFIDIGTPESYIEAQTFFKKTVSV